MFDEEDRETGYALSLPSPSPSWCRSSRSASPPYAIGQLARSLPMQPPPHCGCGCIRASSAAVADLSMVKLYFDLGKAELPADAVTQLAPLLTAARDKGGKWVVSGYHDASGDAMANAELASSAHSPYVTCLRTLASR